MALVFLLATVGADLSYFKVKLYYYFTEGFEGEPFLNGLSFLEVISFFDVDGISIDFYMSTSKIFMVFGSLDTKEWPGLLTKGAQGEGPAWS